MPAKGERMGLADPPMVEKILRGIEDQADDNPTSRVNDDTLVEGGQLLFFKLDDGDDDD